MEHKLHTTAEAIVSVRVRGLRVLVAKEMLSIKAVLRSAIALSAP